METNMNKVAEYIVKWMTEYSRQSGTNGWTMGISGGIDSAVVSTLAAMTGKDLLVLEMPIHQDSEQVTRAQNHIAWLKENFANVTSKLVDLTKTYEALKDAGVKVVDDEEDYEFSLSNSRSRLRMTTLYQIAGQLEYLVAGTGNKVEDFGIGFYTKYGDGGVDMSPIADLMKSEVYALGKELGLIEEILNAVPTDGLHDDARTDEEQIGASYDELEWAMAHEETLSNITDRQKRLAIELTLTEREKVILFIYRGFHSSNEHKMLEIPVCFIPEEVKYSEVETVK